VRIGKDASEDVGEVGHRQKNCDDVIGKDDGKITVPVLLVPFLIY
jgi:hypothetical protein